MYLVKIQPGFTQQTDGIRLCGWISYWLLLFESDNTHASHLILMIFIKH